MRRRRLIGAAFAGTALGSLPRRAAAVDQVDVLLVLAVEDFDGFARAIRRKLILELAHASRDRA